jgi:NAD(P)-dependent dehydrogenase (short-subunit alcohol dehydrogenase family)
MKVIVIGSSGIIGSAVVRALEGRHQVVGASRHGELRVDLEDPTSIEALFAAVWDVDAVVCCAGGGAFKPLAQLSDQDFAFSLNNKLMGQVRVIRAALQVVKEGGSITVTSGAAAQRPSPGAAVYSLVNAALEGFVRAAALEAPRGVRVNAVSPPWVDETLARLGMQAPEHLPAAQVAKAYVAAVEGKYQGAVLEAARFADDAGSRSVP